MTIKRSICATLGLAALAGASERATRNWFDRRNGPSGEHLIQLFRHSDDVFEAVLTLAGRERVLTAKVIIDARDKLVELLEHIRQLDAGWARE